MRDQDEKCAFREPDHRAKGPSAKPWFAGFCLLVLMMQGACSRRPPDSTSNQPAFEDVTEQAGIARVTPTYDAAIGDFDGDGRLDIYVGNHTNGAVLLRNLGDGRFVDVLPGSGIEPKGDQHGSGWGDYDNDGRLDLMVSLGAWRGQGEKQNRLYHNEGGGHFRDVALDAGVADPLGRSRSVAWLDYDNDGWLDLFIANFKSPNRLFHNRHDGTFEDVSDATGISSLSATRVTWADYDGDGYPDLLLSGTPKGLRLLHNEGGKVFSDVTEQAGLDRPGGPSQGMAFGDYDNDGNLDLYVSFGTDFNDVVHDHGDGHLKFAFFANSDPIGFDFVATDPRSGVKANLYENGSPVAPERVLCGPSERPASARFDCGAEQAASAGMPPGEMGFVLWRDPAADPGCTSCPTPAWHLRWRGAGDHHLSGTIDGATRPTPVGFKVLPAGGGILWHNMGSGRFSAAHLNGLAHHANGQGVTWADVNDDGWLDLYVVDSGSDGEGGHNLLFLNRQGVDFELVPASSGASPSSGDGRAVGAHFFDFDDDGRLDLFLTNGWGAPPFDLGPYHLLHNVSAPAHWLEVVLEGRKSNREGLGAWVEIEACGRKQRRYHNGAANYFSQSAVGPHFGLGDCGEVSTLRIKWPSGKHQELHDLHADQVLRVVEAD